MVTIVVAARPGQADVKAVEAGRRLRYPPEKLEIIVARGRQPSAQRNAAIKAARGEWIYFLDDDSVPDPANLERASVYLSRPEVQMVGGPNVCPPDAPWIEQVFALVLASWLAFGPSRARYAGVGEPRETSEKELILCNLLARRKPMLELGGFNEALYPNEENALMDELQKRGGRLMYYPAFFVFRRPRANLNSFARMLMTYGRGRAEQFRLHPTPGSALNFVPPLFCAYLLALAALLAAMPSVGRFMLLPMGLYAVALLAQGLALVPRSSSNPCRDSVPEGLAIRVLRSVAAIPLIVLTHVLYGVGFWRGLFTRLRSSGQPAPGEVVLEKIQ